MERLVLLIFSAVVGTYFAQTTANAAETVLSTVLTSDTKEKTLNRQGRSYYDQRYPPRPIYGRLDYSRPEYDRPVRCGRCDDDDRDDYDRSSRDRDRDRDRYDDDRRGGHKPTSGNRYDRNKNYDSEEDEDRRYNTDRNTGNKNGTDGENQNDGDKNRDDDKDSRPSGSRRRGGNRDRNRNDDRDRDRDRDRYRPDYYDRFLRDPYRERPYYDDPYRERRPLYDRYDDPYGGRYEGNGYAGYRRPAYDDRYDDRYGGYAPGLGTGPHDRPWDETYRGQAGWDAGGRGYYFASGRPDAAPAQAWTRPEYTRPEQSSGWQNVGYGGYSQDSGYRGSAYGQDTAYRGAGYGQGAGYRGAGYGQAAQETGYGQGTYRQDLSASYPQSGWHSVGERRPYRDESGVNKLDDREGYRQPARGDRYGEPSRPNYQQPAVISSSTTQTSYLFQREDESVTKQELTTKAPS